MSKKSNSITDDEIVVNCLALELTSHVNAIFGEPQWRDFGRGENCVTISNENGYAVLTWTRRPHKLVLHGLVSKFDVDVVNRMIAHYGFGTLHRTVKDEFEMKSVALWENLVDIIYCDNANYARLVLGNRFGSKPSQPPVAARFALAEAAVPVDILRASSKESLLDVKGANAASVWNWISAERRRIGIERDE